MIEFWYVYKEYGGGPRYEHDTFDGALAEAKRLTVQTGGRYYVLKVEAVIDANPGVTYTYPGAGIMSPPVSPYSESMCTAIAAEQDPYSDIPF